MGVGTELSPIPSVRLTFRLSVGPVGDLWKMVDWIWMLFVVVSGVGQRMGVLDKGGNHRREGAILGVNGSIPL